MVARAETTFKDSTGPLAQRVLHDTRVTFTSSIEIEQPLTRWAQRYIFTMERTLDEMLAGLKRETERQQA